MLKCTIFLGILAVISSIGAFKDLNNARKFIMERLENEYITLDQATKDPATINKNFSFVKRGTVKENGKTFEISIYKGNTAYVIIKENQTESKEEWKPQVLIYKKSSDDLTAVNLIKQLEEQR